MTVTSLKHADKYSIWISTGPASSSNSFVYVGSEASISYGVNYGGSVMGILGKRPSGAIYMDGTGGAVGNIKISGAKRANPKTTSTLDDGETVTQSDLIGKGVVSNKKFIETMEDLISATQMFQNAYIIRLYGLSKTEERTDKKGYRELYFFITSCNTSIDFSRPNELSVDLSGYIRNKEPKFGGR